MSFAEGDAALIAEARAFGAICVEAPEPNRGQQLDAGAAVATGKWLLFHHADSHLTGEHLRALASLDADAEAVGGAFYRLFDERHPTMRRFEPVERWHNRTFGALYGDQSIFARRRVFTALGGFRGLPLMEDVDFSLRLRRAGKVVMLDPPMTSSPRRHRAHGPWRTTFFNLALLLLFRLGVSPHRLHAWYYRRRASAQLAGAHVCAEKSAPLPVELSLASPPAPRSTLKTMHHLSTAPAISPSKWRARWDAFRQPVHPEKAEILRERWASLPAELQTPNQISGRHLTHCGFTLGASYCSFHCTHCYLPKNANDVPLPSLAQMKEQIDANRRFQGPGGGMQLTGGDVADAYWRSGRQDELVEVVRYAYSVGLVPMLMTHGQTLIEHPEFLERLVVEGGLRQVSIHIDMTQAGRHGFPIGRVKSEADLHPVREAFTQLGWKVRRETGVALEFALSFTVTRKNIGDVPEVIRWYLAKPERTQLWRMLSFQPEADTGRTIFSQQPITPALSWEKIQEGIGLPVRRDVSIFGHPDCNSWTSLLVSQSTGAVFPTLPDDAKWDTILGRVLERIGGISLVTDDARTAPYRLAGALAQNPLLAAKLLTYLVRFAVSGKMPSAVSRDLLRGKVHTVGIGMHNFMDAAVTATAPHDPVIKARLDSCVFKGAVKQDGEWTAVPMCQMNQERWGKVYDERLADPLLRAEPQVGARGINSAVEPSSEILVHS